MLRFTEVDDFNHLDNLIQVLHDLFDLAVVTKRGQGQSRQRRVFCWRHGERLNVVVSLCEETNNPGERASFVFQQYCNDMTHYM